MSMYVKTVFHRSKTILMLLCKLGKRKTFHKPKIFPRKYVKEI